jgi:thiol-disulfide isomerase/thioredoxin
MHPHASHPLTEILLRVLSMSLPSLSLVRRSCITLVAFAIIAPAMFTEAPLVAQEEVDQAAEAAAPDAAATEELLKVPSGDAKVLHAYIEKLATTPPPEDASEEEQAEYATKMLTALVTAADRLLDAKPTDKQAIDASGYRIQALQALVGLGQEGADKKLEAALKLARQDKREEIAGMGWQFYIRDRVMHWSELTPEAKQAFHDEIVGHINEGGVNDMDVSIVQITAMQLDGTDDAFVIKLLEETAPLLAKAEKKALKEQVAEANFEGMLRRLKLPGNEMEITGELLSGGKVDWDSYRGKVVLVDFWATWCGPCRAEIPNVLAMYEAYHDKGFDVLGVSLDKTPDAAKKYVAENKLPWDSLFPAKKADRFWNHPLAKHYGIGGIPTAILVDQQGKVVNMNARGEILGEELKRLLGEPAPKKETAEAAASGEAS